MKINNASILNLGAAPWKFILLAATLLFTYALPVHADDHEEAPVTTEEAPADEADAAPYEDSYEVFTESEGFALFTVSNFNGYCNCCVSCFLMHLGFATLESGLCQSKNTVNILFKNVFIMGIGILTYAFYGFNAMYPGEMGTDWNGYFATGSWFGVDPSDTSMITDDYAGYTWWTDFLFQAMFAATGATIVSGAVAERIKLPAFMLFAVLFVGCCIPDRRCLEMGWRMA